MLAILLIAMFLEPIDDNPPNSEGEKSPPFWSTLLSTFMLLRDKRLCLLILLPLYSGLQQGFISGEYTRVSEKQKLVAYAIYRMVSVPPVPTPRCLRAAYLSLGQLVGKAPRSQFSVAESVI